MGFFENMGNPKGKLGKIQLKSMNKEHTPVSLWGLKHIDIKKTDVILDIGCGGGMNVNRMAQKAKKVYGVDYSSESVNLSREINHDLIKRGVVEIHEENVLNLPYHDNSFDIVTAFETVYFWPEIENSFGEVKRVLKPDGIFLIGMESNGSDNIIMKLWNHFIDMNLYTDDELVQYLKNNEFKEVTSYLWDGKNSEEIIKTENGIKRISDGFSNASITDKFLE